MTFAEPDTDGSESQAEQSGGKDCSNSQDIVKSTVKTPKCKPPKLHLSF